MSVYDKARELVIELRKESTYTEFVEWQEKVLADPDLKAMLTDLRSKEFELQKQELLGQEVPAEQRAKLHRLYDVVRLNPALRRYLELEYRFIQMMMDIQKTINEAMPIKLPEK
ncbi:MAG: YlbF family regulator [Firmicutes bacterium]|nr:YlbF family regulator [Bacillota bacterium]